MCFDLYWDHLAQVLSHQNEIIITLYKVRYARKGALKYISNCAIVVTVYIKLTIVNSVVGAYSIYKIKSSDQATQLCSIRGRKAWVTAPWASSF
jgi:ABC-type glycerol-3-phosphate transport system permease component